MLGFSNRRRFLAASAAGLGAVSAAAQTSAKPESPARLPAPGGKLALLGGAPVRKQKFPSWPNFGASDEKALLDVLHSRLWCRMVAKATSNRFEEAFAKMLGAKHLIAVNSGTMALVASLHVLGVGPGDEVIVPVYTFGATVNCVFMTYALPVFVDVDPETFQIDTRKIEKAITPRTAAVIPVHQGGNAADMDAVLALAKKHKLRVVEDACHGHLAEWRGRKLGTLGDTGCFSLQVSKLLTAGEGGLIATMDDEIGEKCFKFQNNGRGLQRNFNPLWSPTWEIRGANIRMTEFQAALLHSQLEGMEERARLRSENADYLTGMLKEIPGILPAKMYPGCTLNSYHIYMARYKKEHFAGVPRDAFLKALRAEGIPMSTGYTALNREPFIQEALESKAYRKVYPREVLASYMERNRCPVNDQLLEEQLWLWSSNLLGTRQDMEQIAEAVRKIQANAAELRKA